MYDIRQMIRKSKSLSGPFPSFNINEVPESPYELFLEWFGDAVDQGVHEPHAMTLSTTDQNGFPDARVLIIKDVDQDGWYFASSSKSAKGKQMELNPKVALTFYWSLVGRQVRIRGKAFKMKKEMSANDFLNRGMIARAIALLDKQSSVLNDPLEFEEQLTKEIIHLQQEPNTISPSWTLYRVQAKEVEFWQADKDRKHTRLQYTFDRDKWVTNLLWA
ncbi:pyridoxine/pyridoxamine 5'-phosphate oxidase [Fictibacillus barbaricus]|uniref:Pyridoxamine 5'-phosphate oxidase n=1 Tax=Fictibacillus barbaricus TaxID=182136 RepID=A0ABU1TWS4_9BACL|nr:pyridoxal 5'-phosphate synthase [Fictibacillus barbaricus]MDR7071665.1 pyridoxamine 5'-phosphate oxidase [Fictibacillus barbaricus]